MELHPDPSSPLWRQYGKKLAKTELLEGVMTVNAVCGAATHLSD